MNVITAREAKPYKGIAMEGILAKWYAKNTGKNLTEFSSLAKRIAAQLQPGDAILEIAPGPGYLAIELARFQLYRIAGIDISYSFVSIARGNAARAGVEVDFRQGNAAALPFETGSLDFIVCRAAFKNFSDPVGALHEMHRVLRLGKKAMIIDLRSDASDQSIADEVAKMHLGQIGMFLTRTVLAALRKRAYSKEEFKRMIEATPFGHGDIVEQPLGFEIGLVK